MKKAFLTILATACVFTAGVFAGIWIQRNQPIPAPPGGLLTEIRDVPLSASGATPKATSNPSSVPQLKVDAEKIQADIDAFKKKLEPIKADFREQLDLVLTVDQREKLKTWSERGVPPSVAANDKNAKSKHSKDGIDAIVPIVIVPSTLDRLTVELNLDEGQRTAVQALLLKRRARFLELVDTTPPRA